MHVQLQFHVLLASFLEKSANAVKTILSVRYSVLYAIRVVASVRQLCNKQYEKTLVCLPSMLELQLPRNLLKQRASCAATVSRSRPRSLT